MNYIGSKYKLTKFLTSSINGVCGTAEDKIICDIFAGTGAVGRALKPRSRKIIANDAEYYSYALNRHYIGNHSEIDYSERLLELNSLPGIDGFIYQNYCVGSGSGRQYFSDDNGRRIDAIRLRLEDWLRQGTVSEDLFFLLLTSLLEAADAVANTASVYGAFLKHLKKTAQKEMRLEIPAYSINDAEHDVYNCDANDLIHRVEGDILYMDPPYNHRQYGSNYHMLNTIALYDKFEPSGKTGLRGYTRSKWCVKNQVADVFSDIIANAQFKYIFLSYNNEGLMSIGDVQRVMSKYGRYQLLDQPYQRFKADRDENRTHKATSTMEYLHVLEKS